MAKKNSIVSSPFKIEDDEEEDDGGQEETKGRRPSKGPNPFDDEEEEVEVELYGEPVTKRASRGVSS
jgi:hypothetical protein